MRRCAFTLIELLVSIAIIALLVGILIPTLSLARNRAQSSVCLSNMRQIGLAMLYYGGDYQDLIARASMTANMGPPLEPFKVRPWGEAIVPYLLSWKKEGFSRYDADAAEVFGRLFRGVYRCPSDANHITEGWAYDPNYLYNGHWSYAKNVIFEYNANWDPKYGEYSKFRLIPNPTATILFGENISKAMSDHFMVDEWYVDPAAISVEQNRHGSKSNYLFADGHAEAVRFSDTWDPSRSLDNYDPPRAR